MKTFPHASAIIDGMLCQLNAHGTRSAACAPLGSAIVEFRQTPFCVYVREHPYGLLPGIANLYCLDGELRLRWMAAWPDATDLCAAIIGHEGEVLVVEAVSGNILRLDAHDGSVLGVEPAIAVAG